MSRYRIVNTNKGSGLVNSLINNLPVELHLPGYRYCGPGTKLKERLARGERGVNRLDEFCKFHDIAYDKSTSLTDRHKADEILENQAWEVFKGKNSGLKEKAAAWLVTNTMKLKRKVGMGCGFKAAVRSAKKAIKNKLHENNIMKLAKTCVAAAKKTISKNKTKTKTPRVIPIPKKGGVLPLIPIFAGLSALGALTGGIANVVKTVNDMKTGRNVPIHLGKGLYLKPYTENSYKIGKGNTPYSKNTHKIINKPNKGGPRIKTKKKLIATLPDRALYDYEIIKYAQALKIPHFIGVFSRDKLPVHPKHTESAIINLDVEASTGTHWVAYKKIGDNIEYYDSFGNLQLISPIYFRGYNIRYNYNRHQKYNTTNCGHLCLKFLSCTR